MITAQISLFAFYAARIILVFLFILSFFTIAFFVERLMFFSRNFLKNIDSLLKEIEATNGLEEIKGILENRQTAETAVVLKGLSSDRIIAEPISPGSGPNRPISEKEFNQKVSAYLGMEKEKWEIFSLFLGSVGSNAPFIGLLGTVLGILKSFADLGLATKGGPQVVMAGISEALVVTAVGLGVAIPAVLFFNICKSRVKKAVTRVAVLVDLIGSKEFFSKSESE